MEENKIGRTTVRTLLLGVLVLNLFSCDEDKIKDALKDLEDRVGNKFIFEESQSGVESPEGWNFVFAMQVDNAANASNLDNDFSVDLSLLEKFINVDLASIKEMIAIAKIDDVPEPGVVDHTQGIGR